MMSYDEQTIIAQCTPKGSGALALLRLSGADVFAVVENIAQLPHAKQLSHQLTHTIHYGTVLDQTGIVLDKVLFLLMRGPQTFTGQDTIEITCHNNPFIIESIIQSAIKAGARIAQQGEFSKRAVLNNKIDLLQAEAINELIHANSQQSLQQSLAQLQGSFSNLIKQLEKQLITALAYTNASFEFIDEEHLEFGSTIIKIIETTSKNIQVLLRSFDQQKQIRQGIRIALIGSVNAGKSSLFNALIGDNRAIVTDQPGTTRDVIEASFYHDGIYWTLADTAGLRQTTDIIEQEGIARSLAEAQKADIILLIIDNARAMTDQERIVYEKLYRDFQHKVIVIHNKTDLISKAPQIFKNIICTASNNQTTINQVMNIIDQKAKELFSSLEAPYLINQRQYNLLLHLEKSLKDIQPLLENDTIPYELVAYHLNEAIAQCAQILGTSVSDLALDAVFKEFCVGK